jgi:hypothetical protein
LLHIFALAFWKFEDGKMGVLDGEKSSIVITKKAAAQDH